MNRRNFLKITIAAGVALATPIVLTRALERRLPVIYGDGIHDDAAGLQAALRGEDFISHDSCVRVMDGVVHINSGTYLIGETLDLTGSQVQGVLTNSLFTADKSLSGPLFKFDGTQKVSRS